MCNCYKPVSEILSEIKPLEEYLIDADKYLAHRPPSTVSGRQSELLQEHVELVQHYFGRLVDINGIDSIIDKLIFSYLAQFSFDDKELANYIKKLFVNTIVFHDFGKVNENFQADREKMNNSHFSINNESPINTTHSKLGTFIFLSKHIDEININIPQRERGIAIATAVILSYTILRHHAPTLNDDWETTISFSDSEDLVGFMSSYLNCYHYDISPQIIKGLRDLKKLVFENKLYYQYLKSFPLYSLVRLNYSLLTAADYLATNDYMNNFEITDFGLLTSERINEIFEFVSKSEWIDEGKVNYNKNTYAELDNFGFTNPKEKSAENLNLLRQEMAVEIIRNTRTNLNKNLFYIEAPTGGGKTNLSMLATLELLKGNGGTLSKVFYVFPFTTLITQTFTSLKNTLGLKSSEIAEIHSKATMNHKWGNENKNKEKEDNSDGRYGDDKRNYIDNLFVNYPFCLLSHIKFFDILKSSQKETNYLLHRLANSIVVIDEMQSYPPQHWDKIMYFINEYARFYNIRFIIMSATLPKLDKLDIIKERVGDFAYLLPEAKEKYFRNPNFCDRVQFNFDLLHTEKIELSQLANRVLEESKKYSELDYGRAKPKGSVYTIIEFIFKNSATEFYSFFENCNFFDEVFVLSGTILEHRRRHIIKFLKEPSNRKKKILLISTQVVEAGVDIDMDLGFKDRFLIDSDEQLAGRINRNVNKKDCMLFLFKYNNEKFIYGSDKRFEITKEKIDTETYKRILEQKDFDHLYDLVINDSNEWNSTPMAKNFSDYQLNINQLKFKSAGADFKLIDNKNLSCFVPLSIGVNIGDGDSFFSAEELQFLCSFNLFPDEDNRIDGEKVFDIYMDMIHNKMDFLDKKIQQKKMQSILSKFVFSIFATDKIEQKLISYYDKDKSQFGYIYLAHWQDFYDEISGLNSAKFESNQTQFL